MTMGDVDLGQVDTKRFVADYMVNLFTLEPGSTIIDPCFGTGVFIDSIIENTDYITVGYEIDKSLYLRYKKQNVKTELINEDFLLYNHNQSYDGVIMNPPYIRHEKIDDLSNFGITKDLLREKSEFSELPKTANLYMYFIVKALNLLKNNGELIVIFPESWLNARSGKNFKGLLEKRCSVVKRVHIKGSAFEQSKLVGVVILKLTKSASFATCPPLNKKIENGVMTDVKVINYEISMKSKRHFSEYANIRRGLTTGCNAIFINPPIEVQNEQKYLVDIVSSPKAVKGYSTNNAVTDKLLAIGKGSIVNDRLSEYLNKCEQEIQVNNSPKTLAVKIKKGEPWFWLDRIDCSGIIFGYIIRRDMRFILNRRNYLVRDNFYIINPKVDVYVLFSLLNNYYIYTQLESKGKNYGGGMLKLQKYDISDLMLFDLSKMSDTHVKELGSLGLLLAESGDKELIYKISQVLSKYDQVDHETIKQQYEHLRSKRLENS